MSKMTLEGFALAEGLTVRVSRLHVIPADQLNRPAKDRAWAEKAAWYESVISGHGHEVTIVTGCGPGHGELTPVEALATLADIARDVSNSDSFESWCEEAGRDPGGDTAPDDYAQCRQLTLRAGLVCGSDAAFEEFIYGTEQP